MTRGEAVLGRSIILREGSYGPVRLRSFKASVKLLSVGAALCLIACTATISSPPLAYTVQGGYDDIASCIYRGAEDTHTFGRDIHLTRLTNPPEIRVAVSSATSRGSVVSLSWEIELFPAGSATRLLVRQAGTLVDSQPFWASFLEPMITRCAGSRPVPA